jgi:hypothetical protein
MKTASRALRRHHRERLQGVRRHRFGRDLSADARALGMAVTTAKPCSCWGCGNQRRYFGHTHQEARLFARLLDIDLPEPAAET